MSWNTSKWVCDANQASFCFAFAGFNMTFSPQNSKKSHCKNISTDLLIASSMMHLMCPCYPQRRKSGLSCYIWTRHVKLGADIFKVLKLFSASQTFNGGDLTARINKYNKKIGLCEFRVLEYDFGPNENRIWFYGSRRAH